MNGDGFVRTARPGRKRTVSNGSSLHLPAEGKEGSFNETHSEPCVVMHCQWREAPRSYSFPTPTTAGPLVLGLKGGEGEGDRHRLADPATSNPHGNTRDSVRGREKIQGMKQRRVCMELRQVAGGQTGKRACEGFKFAPAKLPFGYSLERGGDGGRGRRSLRFLSNIGDYDSSTNLKLLRRKTYHRHNFCGNKIDNL